MSWKAVEPFISRCEVELRAALWSVIIRSPRFCLLSSITASHSDKYSVLLPSSASVGTRPHRPITGRLYGRGQLTRNEMNQHCEYLIVSLKKPYMVSWNIQYYNISKYSYATNTHTQVKLCSYCCKAAGPTTPPSCGSFSIDPWTDFHWRFVVVGF